MGRGFGVRVGVRGRVRDGVAVRGRTDLVGGERAVVELELIDVAVKAARRPPRVPAQEEGARVLDDRAHLVRGRGRVRGRVRGRGRGWGWARVRVRAVARVRVR